MMKLTAGKFSALALALAITDFAAAAQNAPAKKAQAPDPAKFESFDASCIVRISSDPELLPLDGSIVNALLESSPVFGPALQQTIGLAGRNADAVQFNFEQLSPVGSPQPLVCRLMVTVNNQLSPEAKPAAPQFLSELAKRLEFALADASVSGRLHLERRQETALSEQRNASARLQDLQSIRQELLHAAGTSDLSRERIVTRLQSLENERDGLQMDLAGQVATRNALEAQISALGTKLADKHVADDVVAELENVVQLRTDEVRQREKLKAAGQVADSELKQAQEALALARAELARHRQAAVQTAGGELLSSLNAELVKLTIKTAESQARLKFITDQMAEIESKKLLSLADRYEREVETPLDLVQQTYHQATLDLNEIANQMSATRMPTVTVLGGQAE